MSEARKKADWLVVAGLGVLLVLVPLGMYVVGYFVMGAAFRPDADCTARYYDTRWKVLLYSPGGRVEAILRGESVVVFGPDE